MGDTTTNDMHIKKFVDMLIKIGLDKTVECEFSRNEVMEVIHSRQFDIFVSKLDGVERSLLIKGLCKFEEYPDMQFGSTSQIKKLIQLVDDSTERSDLINWLFLNRKNTYIPYGFDIPLSIKSEAEYIDYEQKRSEHRKDMLDLDQKNHTEALERKRKKMQEHLARHKNKKT